MSSGGNIIRTIVPIVASVAVLAFAPGAWAAWQVAAAAAAAGIAASLAVNALFPVAKPDLSFDYDFGDFNTERTRVVRQAISHRRIIYGKCRVGGVYTFIESTKTATASGGAQVAGNAFLHMLITVSGHPVDGFEDIYIFDEVETFHPTTHVSTGPNFTNVAWCWTGDGTPEGDADLLAALKAACPSTWTDAHKQQGCAKVYLRWKWNKNAYTSGLPQPSFVVRGKKVYDPRTEETAYSNNAALCLRDYITSPLGLNAPGEKLPDTEWSAEANICDEDVALAAGGTENRYECNGVVDLDSAPKKIIQAMLTACAGRLVYTAGQWVLYVGAYRTPTVTLTLDDLDGPIKVASRVSRRDLFNGVKGTYVDPEQAWQATDFPPVQVAAYVTEDQGEVLWKDIAMAYTTSPSMAQRIARVELERARRQITVNLSCMLSAYQCMTAETVMLTIERYGWTSKVFEVMSWGFTLRDADDTPSLGIDLTLRETDSGVFSWSTAQEQEINVAPRTNLPTPWVVGAPSGLGLESGTASLYLRTDGTVATRVRVSWDAVEDAFVLEGGRVEGQHKRSDAEVWQDSFTVPATSIEAFILDVEDGQTVDVRVRFVNHVGAQSEWVVLSDHEVVGKTEPPSNVPALAAGQNGNVCTFRWSSVADLDLAGYELRYMHAPFVWADAAVISSVTRGTLVTNSAVPPGEWVVGIKAVDTSGNKSMAATTAALTVQTTGTVLLSEQQAPEWSGDVDGFILHPVSLRLAPLGTVPPADQGWETFDVAVDGQVAQASYTAPEYDQGLDAPVRLYAALDTPLLYGETQAPDVDTQARWALDGEAMGAWVSITGLREMAARRVQMRAVMRNSGGSATLAGMLVVADAEARSEGAAGLAVTGAGASVAFSAPFRLRPNVQVSAEGPGAVYPVLDNVATAGFDVHVYNSAGAEVGGVVDWRAEGV